MDIYNWHVGKTQFQTVYYIPIVEIPTNKGANTYKLNFLKIENHRRAGKTKSPIHIETLEYKKDDEEQYCMLCFTENLECSW